MLGFTSARCILLLHVLDGLEASSSILTARHSSNGPPKHHPYRSHEDEPVVGKKDLPPKPYVKTEADNILEAERAEEYKKKQDEFHKHFEEGVRKTGHLEKWQKKTEEAQREEERLKEEKAKELLEQWEAEKERYRKERAEAIARRDAALEGQRRAAAEAAARAEAERKAKEEAAYLKREEREHYTLTGTPKKLRCNDTSHLYRGPSEGLADCEKKCDAKQKCRYFSIDEQPMHWCVLTKHCNGTVADAKNVKIYAKKA